MTTCHALRMFLAASLLLAHAAHAQDVRTPRASAPRALTPSAVPHVGSSPFDPPVSNDATFVVDQDAGLDTGCAFRSEGPLVFSIMIDRVMGDIDKLRDAGLIEDFVTLRMPAFDVDFAGASGVLPERDRVSFNGEVVPGEFLQGENQVWRLNAFDIPIDLVRFPTDPGPGGTVTPEENVVRIDIDTLNPGEEWCVEIDWAALQVDVPRPVVMAHGILSSGGTWSGQWVPGLDALGIPNSNRLNMGNLDSIQSNARKIRAEVEASKARWGVDQVVIVAHSKGGLDSRHFVEDSNDVERVVQLGTPNAGSPLADVAQAGAIALLGLGGAAIANALAGPAGVQLTQPYMAGYNQFHGSNPEVQYTALAGDYDPDCFVLNPFCRPIDRLLLAITGRGDTIVPVSSVHALSFTANRTFASSGDDDAAKHTSLTGSSGVFAAVRDRVTAPGTPVMQAIAPAGAPARTATLAGVLQQDQTVELPLPIDQATEGFITLLYPSGELQLELVAPSGRVITPGSAAVDTDVEFEQDEVLGGFAAVYSVSSFEPGIWTARISAPIVVEPTGEVTFALSAWLSNPTIRFAGRVPSPYHTLNQPIGLVATVESDVGPLAEANVIAQVALPDGTVSDVTLSDGTGPDAGDGIFQGTFAATSVPGVYRVRFVATNAVGGTPAFSREDFGIATVSRSSSSLVGTFSDAGVDLNGNGLFDELAIGLDIDITDAGTFRVLGRLTDTSGNEVGASAVETLAAGASRLTLRFDGNTLFRNGVDGPYTLSLVRLAEDGEDDLLPLEERTGVHQTAAYLFTQFEHGALFLTGGGSAEGDDLNGNGLFDLLRVSIGVQVESAGFYQWTARLLDAAGVEIDFQNGSANFGAGERFMTLAFDGRAIGVNGADGPYVVADLLLFGAGDSLVATRAFTTQFLAVQQFEGAPPSTTTSSTTSTSTTTIPPGCPVDPTYESVWCRLGDLNELIAAMPERFRQLARRPMDRISLQVQRAEAAEAVGNTSLVRHSLRKARHALFSLKRRFTSLNARKLLDEATRRAVSDAITELKNRVDALQP